MKVYLTSLGCRLNEAELQTWANDFSQFGISVVSEQADATLIVINTCAVTGEASRKSRQTIRRYHRNNPTAKIIITGCYASLEKEEAQDLLGVDLVVSNKDKNKLAEKARELLDFSEMPFAASEPGASALFTRNKERAFIKVQDGCRYRCSYCIVTIARGDEVSRSIEDIVEEINRLTKAGIKEIVITGVHVGGYGSDIDLSLYQLVSAILKKTTIPRIRFASVEPWDLPDNFFELFENKRLMPHMHLPIQSGSNKILKKMSRRCKSETFLALVQKVKKLIPRFNFTTDIIVGFPDESDADYSLSLDMIKQANFGHVHVFSYSKRAGTKAAQLPHQIESQIKKTRSKKMHIFAEEVKVKQLQNMLGVCCDVLFEGEGRETAKGYYRYCGYTPNYHKVIMELQTKYLLNNQIITCEITDIIDDRLLNVVALKNLNHFSLSTEFNSIEVTQIS
ncbi:MAG: tRNA (N(6)-L-threonylcarbamoyladenosine(37)-C(2))-methylthiotransferase MtaB [Gammaproteobacteria bacterium]|nr:MAG: tRNA (N(6)-L-threonylcarbamoyladenosine(37)-C(2))-methylthiotransferase MtaB [Gammaproteobacteria bacterium]